MNTRSKTTLIILSTFILGLIAGALVNRSLTQHRIRRILSQRRPAGFIDFYERVLEPTPEQASEIKNILDRHARENNQLRQDFFDTTQQSLASLRAELKPHLTEEQNRRLNRALEHPPRRGPGPGDSMPMPPMQEASRLQEMLELTPEQTEQLKSILEKQMSSLKFPPDPPSDFRKQRETFLKLQEEINRAIMEILSDEQKQIFRNYLDQRRDHQPPWESPPEKP